MRQVSVEAAFQWAQGFAAREWTLLLPVALAFFALPGLLVDIFMPQATRLLMPGTLAGAPGQGAAMAALVAVLAVNALGALAVTALALVPGISVGEAIVRALRRWPALLGALLLAVAGVLLVTLVLALLLGQVIAPAVLQGVLLVAVAFGGVALWVRLAVVVPVLTERALPPTAALRRSWQLSAAAFWRLFGAIAIYSIGGTVVLMAASSAIGVVIALAAGAADAPSTGLVVSALVFRLLAAVVSTGFQLLVAGLFVQLAGPRA